MESLTVEDVISQNQGHILGTHEIPPDQKGLGQTTGTGLNRVVDGKTDMAPIPEHPFKILDIVRRRDQQYLADTGQHQCREGIIDHRFVVDGQKLLADGPRDRVKPRARTASQNDAFTKHA